MTTAWNRTEPPVNRRLGFEAAPNRVVCSHSSILSRKTTYQYYLVCLTNIFVKTSQNLLMCVASYGARIDLLHEFVGNTTHFWNKTIKINKLIAIISCKTALFCIYYVCTCTVLCWRLNKNNTHPLLILCKWVLVVLMQ